MTLVAHILRVVPGACEGWVSKMYGRSLILPEFSVSTRSSELDPLSGAVIFPDLRIDATTADGESIVVLAEHKWDSPCRVDQLQNYRRIGERTGTKARLAFVGARRDQVLSAKECVDVSLFWENAYELLESVADQSEVLEDFLRSEKGVSQQILTADHVLP